MNQKKKKKRKQTRFQGEITCEILIDAINPEGDEEKKNGRGAKKKTSFHLYEKMNRK